jgi:hypothetical protein
VALQAPVSMQIDHTLAVSITVGPASITLTREQCRAMHDFLDRTEPLWDVPPATRRNPRT